MKNQTSTMMELVSSNIDTVENQVLDNNSAKLLCMSAPDYSQVFQELLQKNF